MVEAREKEEVFNTVETPTKYDLKTELKILCYIKERESRKLETYGAVVQKALGMSDNIYKYIGPLEREGKIARYFKDGKKYIRLTGQGEETIKQCFLKMFPSYETELLLKKFVDFLSTETIQFLKKRRERGYFATESYLLSLDEGLREWYQNRLTEFCRDAESLKLKARCDEN